MQCRAAGRGEGGGGLLASPSVVAAAALLGCKITAADLVLGFRLVALRAGLGANRQTKAVKLPAHGATTACPVEAHQGAVAARLERHTPAALAVRGPAGHELTIDEAFVLTAERRKRAYACVIRVERRVLEGGPSVAPDGDLDRVALAVVVSRISFPMARKARVGARRTQRQENEQQGKE